MSPTRAMSKDGIAIAVQQSGTPSGPVLVAVHGYPDNHAVWDGVAAELRGDFRVATYDVRGAGASGVPNHRSGYRIEHLVDDLVAVLDEIASESAVHLLGHDWGSIQCWAALSDPRLAGRIASYTSISGPSLQHVAVWLRAARQHPLSAVQQLAKSYYTVLFQLPMAPEAAVRTSIFARAIPDRTPRSEKDKVNGLNLYRANMLGVLRRPTPATITVPVQVIAPSNDPYVTPAMAIEAPAPYVANLHTQIVPGGHWVMNERPHLIAELLREFTASAAE